MKTLIVILTLLATALSLPAQQLQNGRQAFSGAVNAKTATYQALTSDFNSPCVTIPVASGTFTITLVASTSQPAAGQCLDIINYGTGVVTIARSGQNLNGGTASLTVPAATATAPTGAHVVSNGTDYFISFAMASAVASTPTFVAAIAAQSANGNSVTTGTLDATGGTLGYISIANQCTAPATTAPTDSNLNPYFKVMGPIIQSGGNPCLYLWQCANCIFGAGQTFAYSSAGSFPALSAVVFKGTTGGQEAISSSTSALTPGAITPTSNNSLLVTAVAAGAGTAISINGGFTVAAFNLGAGGAAYSGAIGYLIQTNAAAAGPTWAYGTGGTTPTTLMTAVAHN